MKPDLSEYSTADLIEMAVIASARESFWSFYRYLNPKFKTGWFQEEVAAVLQQFFEELNEGLRPKYIIEAPPQHGKSKMIVHFIAWASGKNPELKTIYTSFSERLGIRANLLLQRIYDSDKFKKVFPVFQINAPGVPFDVHKNATRSRELIEYIGCDGFIRNTTVRGAITGESLDLGIIDDPIKGREQANSEAIRNATWDWFTDDFLTRFADDAGMLTILTRWHIDDPIGRLKEKLGKALKVFTYKAIAESDEPNRKEGDPLFPEHKSKAFLLERKSTMSQPSWESLYQQNPKIIEGEMIKRGWFEGRRYNVAPAMPIRIVQSWDTAQKAKDINDPSVCTTWAETETGYYLIHVLVFKGEYPALKRTVKNHFSRFDMFNKFPAAVLIEDKSSGASLIQDLKAETKIPVIAINPCADKVTRASSSSSLMESGLVWLPENANWLVEYEEELFAFPRAKHDDQVDSTSQFLNWVSQKTQILIG